MTPYLLYRAVKAISEKIRQENEHDLRMAWYGARFERSNPLPNIDTLLGKTDPAMQNKVVAEQFKAMFRLHNQRILSKQKPEGKP